MPLTVQAKLKEMDAQQKLIEQKKREIQQKLFEHRKKNGIIEPDPQNNTPSTSVDIDSNEEKASNSTKTFNINRSQINTPQKATCNLNEHNLAFDNEISDNNESKVKSEDLSRNESDTFKSTENGANQTKASYYSGYDNQSYYGSHLTYPPNMPPYNYMGYPPAMPNAYNPYPMMYPSYTGASSMMPHLPPQPPLPPLPSASVPPPPLPQTPQTISSSSSSSKPSTIVPLMSLDTSVTQISKSNETSSVKKNENINNLEAEYESFMLLTGQTSTNKNQELYNPDDADDEDENSTPKKALKDNKANSDCIDENLKKQIEEISIQVATKGLDYEDELKKDFKKYWWLFDTSSNENNYYKKCLDKEIKNKIEASFSRINNLYPTKSQNDSRSNDTNASKDRKRKSRWGDSNEANKQPIEVKKIFNDDEDDDDNGEQRAGFGYSSANKDKNNGKAASKKKTINSTKDFMKQMQEATERARNIAEQLNNQMALYPEGYVPNDSKMSIEQQNQFKQHKELQEIYERMMAKRREIESIARQMKFKYEYDSDEEIDSQNGTWEHILRKAEMEATTEWAITLTDMADGKHHIGDFLPPNEFKKFMETYQALKEGRTPDFSDYKEFKLNAENVGFKMLQKLGWQDGQGLGKNNQGQTAPVNKGKQSFDNAGLSETTPNNLNRDDDEFSMYRKRMMLAYKFRPNPLNNPRRPY